MFKKNPRKDVFKLLWQGNIIIRLSLFNRQLTFHLRIIVRKTSRWRLRQLHLGIMKANYCVRKQSCTLSPSSLQSRAVSPGKLYFRIHGNFFLSFLKQQVSRFQKTLVTELFPQPPVKLYVGAHVLSLLWVCTWRGGEVWGGLLQQAAAEPTLLHSHFSEPQREYAVGFLCSQRKMLLCIAYAVRSCLRVQNTRQNSTWHVCTHLSIMISFLIKCLYLGFKQKLELSIFMFLTFLCLNLVTYFFSL